MLDDDRRVLRAVGDEADDDALGHRQPAELTVNL
jgi:hypothetical protein